MTKVNDNWDQKCILTNNLQKQMHKAQESDEFIQRQKEVDRTKGWRNFGINSGGILRFIQRMCVPNNGEIKKVILE